MKDRRRSVAPPRAVRSSVQPSLGHATCARPALATVRPGTGWSWLRMAGRGRCNTSRGPGTGLDPGTLRPDRPRAMETACTLAFSAGGNRPGCLAAHDAPARNACRLASAPCSHRCAVRSRRDDRFGPRSGPARSGYACAALHATDRSSFCRGLLRLLRRAARDPGGSTPDPGRPAGPFSGCPWMQALRIGRACGAGTPLRPSPGRP